MFTLILESVGCKCVEVKYVSSRSLDIVCRLVWTSSKMAMTR